MKHNQQNSKCYLIVDKNTFEQEVSQLIQWGNQLMNAANNLTEPHAHIKNCEVWEMRAKAILSNSFSLQNNQYVQNLPQYSIYDGIGSTGIADDFSLACQLLYKQVEYIKDLQKNAFPYVLEQPKCGLCSAIKNLFGKKTMILIALLTLFLGFTTNAWATNARDLNNNINHLYYTGEFNGWSTNNADYEFSERVDGNHYKGVMYVPANQSEKTFKLYADAKNSKSGYYAAGGYGFHSEWGGGEFYMGTDKNDDKLSTISATSGYVKVEMEFYAQYGSNSYLNFTQTEVSKLGASLSASSTTISAEGTTTLTPGGTGGSGSYTYSYSDGNAGGSFNGNVYTAPLVTTQKTITITLTVKDKHNVLKDNLTAATKTINITVKPLIYDVTFNTNGGTINSGDFSSYTKGVGATLPTDVTKTGYDFGGWFDNSGLTGSAVTTISTTATGDKEYWAKWTEKTHNITISNDGNGSTDPTGEQTNVGEVTGIEITATPNQDYGFKEWIVTGGTVSSQSATTTFKPTADNATIQATFQSTAVYYTWGFGVYQSTGGTVESTVAAGDHVQGGTSITLTAHPATGYEVEGWYNNADCTGDKLQTGGDTYTFSISSNSVRYVKFKEKTFSVTVQAGTGIDQVTGGGANVGQLTGTAITATVKSGYTWSTWTGGIGTFAEGATVKDNTFRPTAASTLTATATENKTAVTVSSNNTTWGTVSPASANVGVTTTATLTATKNSGYKFVSWALTGGATLSSGALTDAQITIKGDGSSANGTAVATFEEDLSSTWHVFGPQGIFCPSEAWHCDDNNMMLRSAANSKDVTFTINITEEQKGKDHTFRIYNTTGSKSYGWGSNNDDKYVFDKTLTTEIYINDHDLHFFPSITGKYTFTIADITATNPSLTVHFPSVNALNSNFSGSWGRTNGTVTDGVLTVEYDLQESEIKEGLEFEMIYEGTYYGPTEDGHSITPDSKDTWDLVAGQGHHVGLIPSIAGTYTFVFDSKTNKLTYTYPTLPSATTTTTEARYFGETPLTFIGGNGSANDPYLVYTDEKITITASQLEAQDHLTAMYKFGEDDASAEVLTKTIAVTSTDKKSIEVKAFYQVNGYNAKGETTAKTIYYQGVAKPSLHLTASWYEKEENAVADDEQVTIFYSTTNYNGAATVTSQVDNAEAQSFMPITNETTKYANYQLPDKELHRYTFTATATPNSRTFTATTSVSVYRLVKITVTDADNLMDHYYMWIQDSNPIQYEQAWPGKTFYSKLGNAHIFYVKYPSYTHFILNNGKEAKEEGAAQTINVAVPNQSTCYTIGTKVTGEENPDKGKYQVETAECPNKLYVGNIADVEMYNGEGKLVQPQVDTDPDLDVANLNVSVTFGTPNIVTYDQRGTGFMLTALSRGTTTAIVTYSIAGATDVVKNFNVTVGEAITIQAKIGTNLGWNSHEAIWIKYWGTDGEHNTQMKFVKYVAGDDGHSAAGQDYYTARLPMPDGSSKIRFKIGYPNGTSWDDPWRNSDEVPDVDKSGCYTVYFNGNDQTRGISRDGDNCFVDYQVEIDMNSGISYFSNKVDNNTDIVSFFAPGSNKSGYEGGSVRIMKNGEQSASISPETFETSGIYTAKISGDGTGLTDVALYMGDYYIRTDAAADNDAALSTGWDDYKKTSHKFTQFSLYPGAKYDYYWVKNNKRTSDETHFNVKGCVGNDYNPDLANMISVNDYTDGNGDIVQDKFNGVNLRFGYNPQTNYFERAILKGAGDNYFLNIQGANVYNDKECSDDKELNGDNYNSHPEYSKFTDVSDWVYEKLIFAKIDGTHPLAQVVLKSKSFNNKIMYQLGYEVDEHGRATKTPIQKVVMGNGTVQDIYTLRVIYDYKTNRLSASWEPSDEISSIKTVDADILFVSNGGNDVNQITFGGDSAVARLESLQSVMFVLEIEKNSNDQQAASDEQYWFSLPFECKISDIFGVENYITLDANRIATQGYWGIMRYRGDLRAKYGWFEEDRPEGFWEWMYPSETLVPGEGYVLYVEIKSLSWNSINVEEPCESGDDCHEGKRSVPKFVKRFYFPSLVKGFTMNKTSEATSKITYPDQPCNITSPKNRRAEDSNWKVIAPNSYNNITINSAKDQDQEHVLGPNFIYVYDEHAEKGSRYAPRSTEEFNFKAFHGYMAQYGGTITWNPFSKTEHPTSAPRFAEEPSFKGGMLTIELVQNNEQLDRTFVKLSKNGTAGFDQNLDLTKITENCAQIASVSEDVLYAGNTLPLDIETVPLNVKVVTNGTYDIALEQSLEGLEVRLYDAFEQTTTPLDLMSATVTLDKGEYKDRFFLQFVQKSPLTPTNFNGAIDQFNLPTDKTQKLLINDNIYLINAGRIYNASGTQVK